MKLSDAIMLGLGLIEFKPTIYLGGGCGCLLGAAYAASTGVVSAQPWDVRTKFAWVQEEFDIPNNCTEALRFRAGEKVTADYIIGSYALMLQRGEITLDEILAWIKRVEPAEALSVDNTQEVEVGALVRA